MANALYEVARGAFQGGYNGKQNWVRNRPMAPKKGYKKQILSFRGIFIFGDLSHKNIQKLKTVC
ncbi:hypothetical protein [Thermosynechococcus sp.]|uniref:hypothetical protein n=1 Tax=Thermosynechococcus sp. TaxID=2814275 RepID=UPI00391D3062